MVARMMAAEQEARPPTCVVDAPSKEPTFDADTICCFHSGWQLGVPGLACPEPYQEVLSTTNSTTERPFGGVVCPNLV